MQTVFKVQSDMVPYSRNAPRGCVHCLVDSERGSPSFPICSGCRSGIAREHQTAHWPLHKAFCRQQARNHELIESHQSPRSPNLPPLTLRKRLIEDFVDIHRRSIEQGIASAIHVVEHPFDFSKQFAFFRLTYNPQSGDNPSTAFMLQCAHFHDNPTGDNNLTTTFEAFLPLVEKSDQDDRGKPGYLGTLTCAYEIDNEFMWISSTPIFECDLPKWISDHSKWLWCLKYAMAKGLVFRLREGPGKGKKWKPGVMTKDQSRWVWKEKSVEELREYDIQIPQSVVDE